LDDLKVDIKIEKKQGLNVFKKKREIKLDEKII